MAAYYILQRSFGALRTYSPQRRFDAAVRTFDRIAGLGADPKGATYLEVGTGRVPVVPMLLWLMGAERTITVDLNRYLMPKLTLISAQYMIAQENQLRQHLGNRLVEPRYEALKRLMASRRSPPTSAILDLFSISYQAPADAAKMHLPSHSIDYHVSYTVLEHVTPHAIAGIFTEARRLLRHSGIAMHYIDYSDHFSHSDTSIDAVHFLRFNESQWAAIADNRFMFANRLRDDDYQSLFESVGLEVALHEQFVNDSIEARVASHEVPLDPRFQTKSPKVLATTSAWYGLRPHR